MNIIILPYLRFATLTCIFGACFFLPFKTSLSNIGLIGLSVTTIIALLEKGFNKENNFFYFLFFSPMVFFLPLLVGFIYSDYPSEASEEIIKYIFLGLTPLFLFRKDIEVGYFKRYASLGLFLGACLSALFLLMVNLWNFYFLGENLLSLFDQYFTGEAFIKPLKNLHPIYLGMYYNMALAVLLFGKVNASKSFRILAFIILILGIFFLASRAIYWVASLIILLYIIHHTSFKIFAVIITSILVFVVLLLPKIEESVIYKKSVDGIQTELTNHEELDKIAKQKVKDTRFTRWQLGFKIVEENPLIGVGTGAENEVLLEQYKAYSLKDSIHHNYNAHNQFLGFAIRFGVLGVLLLIIYFVKNTIKAIKHQNLLFLAFLTILFWTFMVENILDRNMGINFVALFGTLFYAEFLFANFPNRQNV